MRVLAKALVEPNVTCRFNTQTLKSSSTSSSDYTSVLFQRVIN